MNNPYASRAFPSESDKYGPDRGMSLRDYFAAKALQGLVANGQWIERMARRTGESAELCAAKAAYEVADAMLVARGDA